MKYEKIEDWSEVEWSEEVEARQEWSEAKKSSQEGKNEEMKWRQEWIEELKKPRSTRMKKSRSQE